MPEQHDLMTFFDREAQELTHEYERIRRTHQGDNGTAGDQGEENWATLLRGWLPAGYHVITKGALLSSNGSLFPTVEGKASPQIDIVILPPSYPVGMINKGRKVYLADAVVAAFECKLTLTGADLIKAARNAKTLRSMTRRLQDDPYHFLFGSPIYGVLAHSHTWAGAGSAMDKIDEYLQKGLDEIDLPHEMLDMACVSDVGTWTAWKLPLVGRPGEDWTTVSARIGRIHHSSRKDAEQINPLYSMMTTLLRRMAWADPTLRPIASYFEAVKGGGMGGPERVWDQSIYPKQLREQIRGSRDARQRQWEPWSTVLL
ncbi:MULTISPECIES: DUF6602 domain-containing protein [Kitasatospora]|uniref:DUF6602 domain-containing protein n=1 Tax=Kitasatospora setae (strain ATCC 33774 / DSM 43861 / JCM 3304 / KCC A-0304 / NBRC 14216 / KM-6054) TaxID=452652 RepID=E4NAP5_KITSK|nr:MULTISPECIES: DUF6602 domain-containing protein [Kitasatospora]BAJ28276.1 hypothetical protein KSE_24620 [Kitasatospora setae KM-6054]